MLRSQSVLSGWLDRNPTESKLKYGKVIMKEAFAFIIHSITVLLRGSLFTTQPYYEYPDKTFPGRRSSVIEQTYNGNNLRVHLNYANK